MEAGFTLQIILPLIVTFLMFGVGMSLRIADFHRLIQSPLAAIIGLTNQLLLLPLLAFFIAYIYSLPAELSVGLIVLAASPAAPTSNLFTYLAKGDTALSVSLTATSKLLAVLTLPLFVNIALEVFSDESMTVSLTFLDTFWQLALMVLLPTMIGMTIQHRYPAFSENSQKYVKRTAVAFLALLIIGLAIKERESIIPMLDAAGPAAISLCLLSMLVGYGLSKVFRLSSYQRTAITIEGGMQSGGLAIVIASSILGSTTMAIPAAVYSLVMYLAAGSFVMAGILQRRADVA